LITACSQVKKEPLVITKSDFCDIYLTIDNFFNQNDKEALKYLTNFVNKWENGEDKKIPANKKLDLTKPEVRVLKAFFEYGRYHEKISNEEKKCLDLNKFKQ
jgi:hypothetical protein